jgi:hypothetical protein
MKIVLLGTGKTGSKVIELMDGKEVTNETVPPDLHKLHEIIEKGLS